MTTEQRSEIYTLANVMGFSVDIREFERIDRRTRPALARLGWHGIMCDSFFSSILIRMLDSDQAIMGMVTS